MVVRPRKTDRPKRLSPKDELFCKLYTDPTSETFSVIVRSYAKAFNYDLTKPSVYTSCQHRAWEKMREPEIRAKLRELIDGGLMNNEIVDIEHSKLLAQNEDKTNKLGAIKEFNRIAGRVKADESQKVQVEIIGFGK